MSGPWKWSGPGTEDVPGPGEDAQVVTLTVDVTKMVNRALAIGFVVGAITASTVAIVLRLVT